MKRRRTAILTLVGGALCAAHLAALPLLIRACDRDDLTVQVQSPPAAEALHVRAELPANIADRVKVSVDGSPVQLSQASAGPGMHRVEWSVRYRGGFERRVGLTQLVGPFQSPARPACSVRLLVGQRFLDDGKASAGTVAHMARAEIEKNMAGFSRWPVGSFLGVSDLKLEWVRLSDRPWLAYKLNKARIRTGKDSHAEVEALLVIEVTMAFTKARVPVFIAASPALKGGSDVDIEVFADATVNFHSGVYQWVSDIFKGDQLAHSTAQDEIRRTLAGAFGPPAPIPLPGGRKLVFEYCTDRPVEVVTGKYAAIPLALRLDGARPDILPVTFGRVDRRGPTSLASPVALELELDAINGVLYYLWHTGFLDQELRRAGVDRRFNEDPRVVQLLSVRIGDIALSLPPTVSVDPAHGHHQLAMSAEATLQIRDGMAVTPARAYSTLGFGFTGGARKLSAEVELDTLSLTCEPEPRRLVPCYADLVDAVRDNSDDMHRELTRVFTEQLNKIVLNRSIAAGKGMPSFVIERAEVAATPHPPSGVVKVELFGKLSK